MTPRDSTEQVRQLQDQLEPEWRSWITVRSLEDVIADGRAASQADLRTVLDRFAERYLAPPIGRDDL